jgi:hypothetical protein
MPRLSIDISSDEHQKLKAIAALKGQSLKEFVLSRALENVPNVADMPSDNAMQILAGFLDERALEAERGETVAIAPGTLTDVLKERAKGRHGNA